MRYFFQAISAGAIDSRHPWVQQHSISQPNLTGAQYKASDPLVSALGISLASFPPGT